MKCVCPMGGDRTCPDDCLLAVWANMSDTERKTRRKAIAEALYKQKFTMEQIATQLGVTQGTISKDLGNLFQGNKSKPSKTTSNPKGAGRPKGRKGTAKPRNTTVQPDDRPKLALDVLDNGKTVQQTAADAGVSVQIVKTAVAEEKGRREPKVERTDLSMTAQEKLDVAIRQHTRKLDMEFEERCREDCRRWLNEVGLPQYLKDVTKLEHLIRNRDGVMDRITYRKILACLHPDRVQDLALKN